MRLLLAALLLSVSVGLARAQLTSEESKPVESLDTSRTLALMERLSEDVVDNRSGASAGTAVAGSRGTVDGVAYRRGNEDEGRTLRAKRALSQTPLPQKGNP